MGITEETFRVIQEVTGDSRLVDLAEKIAAVQKAQENLARCYAMGVTDEEEFAAENRKLTAELKLNETAFKNMAGSLDLLKPPTEEASVGLNNMSGIMRALASGRLFGLMGQMDQLAAGLGFGGVAGAAGLLTLAFIGGGMSDPSTPWESLHAAARWLLHQGLSRAEIRESMPWVDDEWFEPLTEEN